MLNLRHARVEVAGLSMESLAQRMGRSVSTISRWEAHTDPSVGTVLSWLAACGVSDRHVQAAYLHDIASAAVRQVSVAVPA